MPCADDRNPTEDNARIVPMRLQKFLARSGVASRRRSEDLMTAGRVAINGEVTTELGSKVDPLVDVVTVDGQKITLDHGTVYLMLNKPCGYVTTMSDPQGRKTVSELVPTQQYPGLFPVGRLDLDTSGLLLFMTDGELAHRLLHPKYKVTKWYDAVVEGYVTDREARMFRSGLQLDDGPTAPAEITVCEAGLHSSVTVGITEGRKRQVRRMFSALSHPVVSLHRKAFGELELEGLASGQWRELKQEEVDWLTNAVAGDA